MQVSWYWQSGCNGDPRTHVIAPKGFCQLVPNPVTFQGYKVNCDENQPGGSVQFCLDSQCNNCPVVAPFFANQCLNNDRQRYGSSSYQVTCPPKGTGDIAVPEIVNLRPGHVEINWFE